MNRVDEGRVKKITAIAIFLYWLIAVSSVARILQVFPGRVPMLVIVALHVLPPLLFAWIHGAISYGLRGILTFSAISIIVGSIVENIGVLTGFPFGHYYFTDVMGPKIFLVPIFLGLAYLGMGCLSWTLARVILGHTENALTGSRVITLPLIAALLMVSWDLCLDPVWATVVRAWVWQQGGSYFGCPSAISWAGISMSTSSINCSRCTCAIARMTMPMCCQPAIGVCQSSSTAFLLLLETCSC
jgi:uncharacterized membrane protein